MTTPTTNPPTERREHVVTEGHYLCGETENVYTGESRCEICGQQLYLIGFDAWWEARKSYHP